MTIHHSAPAGHDLDLGLAPVAVADFQAMLALRIEALRESLERLGRFDPERAEARFRAGFEPAYMQHIVLMPSSQALRIGFFTLVPLDPQGLYLRHLYLKPGHQGRGAGTWVMNQIKARARVSGNVLTLGALKHSDANRFYLRHGFELTGAQDFDLDYRWDPATESVA